jgi:phenylalanyl-tRNA synthetase beta chain
VVEYLARMGLRVVEEKAEGLAVGVPFYRTDVLHEVDILEDILIAHGYSRVQPQRVMAQTVGKENYLNKVSNMVREEMAIAGYNETLTFALCSAADMTTSFNREVDPLMVRVGNPKNYQF